MAIIGTELLSGTKKLQEVAVAERDYGGVLNQACEEAI